MRLKLTEEKTGGELQLFKEEAGFDALFFSRDRFNKYFTIAWNPGESSTVTIDDTRYDFPTNSLLPLLLTSLSVLKRSISPLISGLKMYLNFSSFFKKNTGTYRHQILGIHA